METNIIYNEDCIQGLKKLPDKSVDLILTDPPYGINKKGIENDESLETYYKSLPELFRILKDNGWFITYTSSARLPEMFNHNPFTYVWCGFVYYVNMQRIVHSPIGRSKQSTFLIFKKGEPKRSAFIQDVHIYKYRGQKVIKHGAPKPEIAFYHLVRFGSKKGDIVLDPFAGSGTSLVCAKQLERQFIGFEISPEYCKIIKKRLSQKVMTGFFETLTPSQSEGDIIAVKQKPQISINN